MIFSKIFGKKHTYLIFLARKGGRKYLGTIKCKEEELGYRVGKLLEELKDKDKDISVYRTVVAMREDGTEYKMDNPFCEVLEEEEEEHTSRRKRSSGESVDVDRIVSTAVTNATRITASMYESVFNALSQTLPQVIRNAFSLVQSVNPQNIMNPQAQNPVMQNPVMGLNIPLPGGSLRDIADIARFFMDVARNPQKYNEIFNKFIKPKLQEQKPEKPKEEKEVKVEVQG